MFSILPADEQKTKELAHREGVTQTVAAMVLAVGEEERGYVLFAVKQDIAEIVCLRSQDAELEEWLVRAALNAAVNRNAITATCSDPVLFPLLKRLGFEVKKTECEVFIPGFFTRPCCGG